MREILEGRVYLYNFDFLKFRNRTEETMSPTNVFHCQGVCWKFRFGGQVRLYVNGNLEWAALATHNEAISYSLLRPFTVTSHDDVCVKVIDIQRRWFRWFRPNTAHVTLEGLEEDRT